MSVTKVVDKISPIISDPDRVSEIRNIAVIAHVDHGKTTLTDALCVKAGLIGKGEGRRFMDIRPDEQERTITIKSSSVSMPFTAYIRRSLKAKSAVAVDAGDTKNIKGQSSQPKQSKEPTQTSPALSVGQTKTEARYSKESKLDWTRLGSDGSISPSPVLVNLIDSPGHVDFSSEVSAALRLTDGTLVVIDCAKGVCVQTRTVVRQALSERVRPVLFMNKLDKMFTKWPNDPETCYQALRRSVESLNTVIATHHESESSPMGSVSVWPQNGSVGFGSGLQGWGFTLRTFAHIYHDRLGISERKMMKKLWGDNFFHPKTKIWTTTKTKKSQERGFVRYVLKPLYSLHKACVTMDTKALEKWGKRLSQQNVRFPDLTKTELTGNKLFEYIAKRWMPAADPMVDMIANHLPSPIVAQAYRLDTLYTGPTDDETARAIARCDAKGPLTMYISKMIPMNTSGGGSTRFLAFGRVFSGTLRAGDTVRIMGNDYVHGMSEEKGSKVSEIFVKPVQAIHLMIGPLTASVGSVGPGGIVGLKGIDRYLQKHGTIASSSKSFPFMSMTYSVAPVVRMAVSTENKAHGGKLAAALQQLSQSDPLVQVYANKETGEYVVAGSGELHLQVCLKDLEEQFMSGSKLIVSEPVVSFRETVSNDTGISNSTWSLAKSPNKLNRVFASAKPLDINIVSAIVSPDSKSVLSDPTVTQDAKRRARALVSEFKWDSQTAKNVWYVDSDDSCANILSDGTKAVAHLFEVKDTVIAAFQEAVSAGVYTGEPVSNVHVTLEDFKLHGDTNHRNGRQVGAMVKRVVQATQLRSVTRILEPIYSVVISAPKTAESGVYKTLRQRGAILTDADMKPGNIVEVTAIMPVRKSFGFTGQLRGNTHGEAFVQMSFSHWGYVAGLPEEEGSDANCIVKEVRKRKGMPDKLPVLEDYHVKL